MKNVFLESLRFVVLLGAVIVSLFLMTMIGFSCFCMLIDILHSTNTLPIEDEVFTSMVQIKNDYMLHSEICGCAQCSFKRTFSYLRKDLLRRTVKYYQDVKYKKILDNILTEENKNLGSIMVDDTFSLSKHYNSYEVVELKLEPWKPCTPCERIITAIISPLIDSNPIKNLGFRILLDLLTIFILQLILIFITIPISLKLL